MLILYFLLFIYFLGIIEEENNNQNNYQEDYEKEKKINIVGKNPTKGNHGMNQMNETHTRFNKFKPDTGAEFYEEEITNNKVYSPKNNNRKQENINPKFNKNFIKEESPENRFPSSNNLLNNMNFLPHITFYRNQENDFKKKNMFH